MSSVHDWDEEATEILPVAIAPHLGPLRARLLELGYSQHDRERIAGYAGVLGTLEGCAEVEPADRAELDGILERSWPAVPLTSHAWDDLWATPRQIAAYDGSDIAGVAEEWGDRLSASWTLARAERLAAIAEVAGIELAAESDQFEEWDGDAGLYDEPYIPTEQDIEDYRAWLTEQGDYDAPEPCPLPELEPFHS